MLMVFRLRLEGPLRRLLDSGEAHVGDELDEVVEVQPGNDCN